MRMYLVAFCIIVSAYPKSLPAQQQVLDFFDELWCDAPEPEEFFPLPTGYGGLAWDGFTSGSGWRTDPVFNGMTDPNRCGIAIGSAPMATISGPSFSLFGGWFESDMYDGATLTVTGYRGGSARVFRSFLLYAWNPVYLNLNMRNVDFVSFQVTGGMLSPEFGDPGESYDPGPQWFAMDELGVSVVPEPVSLILLGTGLAGVGAAARRRRRL